MDRMKITMEQERVDDGALFIQVYINGNDLPGILPEKILSIVSPTIAKASS